MNRRIILLAALSAMCSSCFVTTEQRSPGVAVNASLASKYVFRGVTMSNGEVLQTSVATTLPTTVENGFLLLDFWSDTNLTGDTDGTDLDNPGPPSDVRAWFPQGDAGEVTGWRQTIAYEQLLDSGSSYAVGLTAFNWPSGVWDEDFTKEIWGHYDWELAGFAPSVELWLDIDEFEGLYGLVGVARSFELSERLSTSVALSVGYTNGAHAERFYLADVDGFADLHASAEIEYSPYEATTLFLQGHYSDMIESKLVDQGLQNEWNIDDNPAWLTLGVRWTF